MGEIIEAANLPQETKVYLKHDFLGWRVVEPWKDPETGKINWFNFIVGGKKNLFILLFIIILAGLFYLGFQEQLTNYKIVMNNPCAFCTDCQEQTKQMINYFAQPNLSKINLSKLIMD